MSLFVADFFSGLDGWGAAFRDRGHTVVSFDLDPRAVSDELWAAVTGRTDAGGVLCVECFDRAAWRTVGMLLWTANVESNGIGQPASSGGKR